MVRPMSSEDVAIGGNLRPTPGEGQSPWMTFHRACSSRKSSSIGGSPTGSWNTTSEDLTKPSDIFRTINFTFKYHKVLPMYLFYTNLTCASIMLESLLQFCS